VELAAYRIVQESLTNVLRHAGPDARATVQVVISDTALSIDVDDDGRALAPGELGAAEFPDGTGAGIAGMRERAAAFGGTLEAGPRRGRGWRVRAVLPLPASTPPPESAGDEAHVTGQRR
jgi:signal transduction histidine kinase